MKHFGMNSRWLWGILGSLGGFGHEFGVVVVDFGTLWGVLIVERRFEVALRCTESDLECFMGNLSTFGAFVIFL